VEQRGWGPGQQLFGAPRIIITPAPSSGSAHCREGNRPMAQPESQEEAHWRKTTNLMLIHLGLWVFFGYIIHMFVYILNKVVILGFPLGFYMAAQGSLIAFVVMLFVFAKQQDKIDREFGFAEDD
jgi:putative solute:sodium symporter small subunit